MKKLFEAKAHSCSKQMFVVGAFLLKINSIELIVFIQRYVSVLKKKKEGKTNSRRTNCLLLLQHFGLTLSLLDLCYEVELVDLVNYPSVLIVSAKFLFSAC